MGHKQVLVGLAWIMLAGLGNAKAQEATAPPVKRAARPEFRSESTKALYFENVFDQALNGQRPRLGLGAATAASQQGSGESTNEPSTTGFVWSPLIGPAVLENEVKSIKLAVDGSVTTPVRFAGGGYQDARRYFSELAMLFAIIQEYDSDVRWKEDAAALRDVFARSAANSKTGSPQAYNEAKLRKQDLQDVVGGNAYAGAKSPEPENDWARICDRSPLMERLQIAFDVVKPGIANESEFQALSRELAQEAALVAAIGEVLTREGMEDALEEDYREQAQAMRDAGVQLQEAIRNQRYPQAVEAVGAIDKACSNCHDNWR